MVAGCPTGGGEVKGVEQVEMGFAVVQPKQWVKVVKKGWRARAREVKRRKRGGA